MLVYVRSFLFLVFFILNAQAEEVAEPDRLKECLKKIEGALARSGDDNFSALGEVVVGLVAEEDVSRARDTINQTARRHREFESNFGKFIGIESIGTLRFGKSISTSMYLWKMKGAATIWQFNFYLGEDINEKKKWILMSFTSETVTSFLARPEKTFQLGDRVDMESLKIEKRPMLP